MVIKENGKYIITDYKKNPIVSDSFNTRSEAEDYERILKLRKEYAVAASELGYERSVIDLIKNCTKESEMIRALTTARTA